VAEATLRGGLKANPSSGALHHSLGLSLVRQGRKPEALAALAKAAQLEPTSARNAYVYAVALHDAGRRAEAVDVLERSLQRHPHDRDTLEALSKLR
jgi:Flp pilus assembly protein TadD